MDYRPRVENQGWQAPLKIKRNIKLFCDCGGTSTPDAKLYSLGLFPCRCPACGSLQMTEDFPSAYDGT